MFLLIKLPIVLIRYRILREQTGIENTEMRKFANAQGLPVRIMTDGNTLDCDLHMSREDRVAWGFEENRGDCFDI